MKHCYKLKTNNLLIILYYFKQVIVLVNYVFYAYHLVRASTRVNEVSLY